MVRDTEGRELRPAEGPTVEITCTNERHGRAVLARLVRMPRWDGAGHYWGMLTRMTDREARAWQAMEPGDGSQTPRAYRERGGDGFYWERNGERVTEPREARLISNAYHHASGEYRQGPPVPGILDGAERWFTLSPCRCGRGGSWRAEAGRVHAVLEAVHAAGRSDLEVTTFRAAVRRVTA